MAKNSLSTHWDDCKQHKHILLNINASLSQFPISWIPKIPIAIAAPPKNKKVEVRMKETVALSNGAEKYLTMLALFSVSPESLASSASQPLFTPYSLFSHLDASCHTKHCYAALWIHFSIQPTPVFSPEFPEPSPLYDSLLCPWIVLLKVWWMDQ